MGLTSCAVGVPAPATDITHTGATLRGSVSSSVEGETAYWFRYGGNASYGSETPHRSIQIADDDAHPVSEPISGLTPDTTYHWQMCVQDGGEDPPRNICSKDQTFLTLAESPFVTRDGVELRLDGSRSASPASTSTTRTAAASAGTRWTPGRPSTRP